jgi:hypothetical protein
MKMKLKIKWNIYLLQNNFKGNIVFNHKFSTIEYGRRIREEQYTLGQSKHKCSHKSAA